MKNGRQQQKIQRKTISKKSVKNIDEKQCRMSTKTDQEHSKNINEKQQKHQREINKNSKNINRKKQKKQQETTKKLCPDL